MLETVEQTPFVDVYERLMPESKRINQRFDFISWFLAYAGIQIRSLGLKAEDLALLGNINGDPDRRWKLLAAHWPSIRTTGIGRAVLRMAWDLYDIEEINDRTWKDVSARLWKTSEKGFYADILRQRSDITMTLVDNVVDVDTRSCCAPIYSHDRLLSIHCRADMEALASEFDQPCTMVEQLDLLLDKSVQKAASGGCVAFKIGGLPDLELPSQEQIGWALGRIFRRQEDQNGSEPALQSYLLHRLLFFISRTSIPLQVHVENSADIDRLGALAGQVPQVRFVGVYGGYGNAFSLLSLARRLPNLVLALGDLWCSAPELARGALMGWLQGVPSSKLFAFSGGTTMVEAIMSSAQIAREHIATTIAEMVAAGSLDEQDASLVIRQVMFENAKDYFDL
jgi:hypothetical protein